MAIEIEQMVTLDNNQNYFVASIIEYEDEKYGLLVNVKENNDTIIVKINNDKTVTRVEDNKDLYNLFNEQIN